MLLATVFISSISPEPGLLMPGQCRTFRRDHMRTECDRLQLRRPPDPHTSASFEALRASGHRRRDVRDAPGLAVHPQRVLLYYTALRPLTGAANYAWGARGR